jgi:hypothetical protein
MGRLLGHRGLKTYQLKRRLPTGAHARFPAGVFSTRENAEAWVARHRLSGTLTKYPLDAGVYDWALARSLFRPTRDDQRSPDFIQQFTCASQEHHHYEAGQRLA